MDINAWGVVEETVVPYFMNSVSSSMGILENQIGQDSFPLFMACHILASILEASVKGKHVSESKSGSVLANGFTGNLVKGICDVTLQMLSHSPGHRSCAITVFLPQLFETICDAFEISVHEQKFRYLFI